MKKSLIITTAFLVACISAKDNLDIKTVKYDNFLVKSNINYNESQKLWSFYTVCLTVNIIDIDGTVINNEYCYGEPGTYTDLSQYYNPKGYELVGAIDNGVKLNKVQAENLMVPQFLGNSDETIDYIVKPIKKPDVVKPDVVKPNVVKPDVVKPNVVKPNVVKPNVVKPDVVKPNVVKPDVVKPDVVKPDVVKPDVVKPNVVKPDVVKPDVVKPNVVKPDVVKPDVVKPDVVKPDVVKPYVVKPDVVKPDVVKPYVVKPDVVKPNVVKPDVVKPYVVKPDVVKPDVVKPYVVKPDVVKPNVVKPDAVKSKDKKQIISLIKNTQNRDIQKYAKKFTSLNENLSYIDNNLENILKNRYSLIDKKVENIQRKFEFKVPVVDGGIIQVVKNSNKAHETNTKKIKTKVSYEYIKTKGVLAVTVLIGIISAIMLVMKPKK